jgi:hypothetical protein
LPKLPTALTPTPEGSNTPMSKSTEDLIKSLHLPPPPSEMNTEEAEIAALEEQLRRVEMADSELPLEAMGKSSAPMSQLHSNLESRILPFWSSVLPARTVRISLFVFQEDVPRFDSSSGTFEESAEKGYGPVVVQQISTKQDGSFALTFMVPWERMCTHPRALQVAYGDPTHEHELFVYAELLAAPPPPPSRHQAYQPRLPREPAATVHAVTTPVSLSYSPIRK